MKLERVSSSRPRGLRELLVALGHGEEGFRGTPVADGSASIDAYLRECREMEDASTVPPGLVPQTTFWILDDDDTVVGMVRVRHRLNRKTRRNGGHIGFYIHPGHRRRGHATRALGLALEELRRIGVCRALLTVFPENAASIRVVEANGGRYEDTASDPETGRPVNRYWVDLSHARRPRNRHRGGRSGVFPG